MKCASSAESNRFWVAAGFYCTRVQLLTEARKLTQIPAELDRELAEALKVRSDLAHRFFERNSEDFISARGRTEMIEELRRATQMFANVDRSVTAIRQPLSARLGITEAMSRHELEQMEKRASERDRL